MADITRSDDFIKYFWIVFAVIMVVAIVSYVCVYLYIRKNSPPAKPRVKKEHDHDHEHAN